MGKYYVVKKYNSYQNKINITSELLKQSRPALGIQDLLIKIKRMEEAFLKDSSIESITASKNLELLQNNVSDTSSKQVNTIYNMAAVTDLISKMNAEILNLKGRDTSQQLHLFIKTHERMEKEMSMLGQKMENCEKIMHALRQDPSQIKINESVMPELSRLSNEITLIKQRIGMSKSHEFQAVHDIAVLAEFVSDLKINLTKSSSIPVQSSSSPNISALAAKSDKFGERNSSVQSGPNIVMNGLDIITNKQNSIIENLRSLSDMVNKLKTESLQQEITHLLKEIAIIKQNIGTSKSQEFQAVHDIAALAEVVSDMKKDLIKVQMSSPNPAQTILSATELVANSERDSVKMKPLLDIIMVQVDGMSKKQNKLVEDIASLSNIVNKVNSESLRPEVSQLFNEITNIKQNIGKSKSQEFQAVHDIAALAEVVSDIKRDLVNAQMSSSTPAQNTSIPNNIATLVAKSETLVEDNVKDKPVWKNFVMQVNSNSNKQKFIIEDLASLSDIVKKLRTQSLKEIEIIKQNIGKSKSQEFQAVHDIAALAEVVSDMKKDLVKVQMSSPNPAQTIPSADAIVANSGENSVSVKPILHSLKIQVDRISKKQNTLIGDIASISNIISNLTDEIKIIKGKNQTLETINSEIRADPQLRSLESHQITAIHDISLLSKSVENLSKDLNGVKIRLEKNVDSNVTAFPEISSLRDKIEMSLRQQSEIAHDIVSLTSTVEQFVANKQSKQTTANDIQITPYNLKKNAGLPNEDKTQAQIITSSTKQDMRCCSKIDLILPRLDVLEHSVSFQRKEGQMIVSDLSGLTSIVAALQSDFKHKILPRNFSIQSLPSGDNFIHRLDQFDTHLSDMKKNCMDFKTVEQLIDSRLPRHDLKLNNQEVNPLEVKHILDIVKDLTDQQNKLEGLYNILVLNVNNTLPTKDSNFQQFQIQNSNPNETEKYVLNKNSADLRNLFEIVNKYQLLKGLHNCNIKL